MREGGRETEHTPVSLLLIMTLIPLWESTLMTSPLPNSFPKAPPPDTITWGWERSGLQHRNLGGGCKHSVHNS